MKKHFSKIVGLSLGIAMAIGVGAGIANDGKTTKPVYADSSAIMTFDFEDDGAHRANTSNVYTGTNAYEENGIAISLTRADSVISGTPINGSANILGRIAKDSTSECIVEIGPINLSEYNITGISYKIKGVTSMTFLGQYSTNGSTWTNLEASANCPSSTATKSYTTLSIEKPSSLYFKLTVGPGNATTKRDFQFDDLIISGETASSKTLSSITVTDNSGKTWHVGDSVSASDLTVIATYSDSSINTITNGTGVTITSGATLNNVGSNTVNVSYTDSFGTANGSVSISAAAAISLTGIAVTTAPTKVSYYEGESFDFAGAVITATFSDNSTLDVTANCTFAPNSSLTTDDDEITISYSYKGVEKTAVQAINVLAASDEVTFTAGTDVGSTTANNSPDEMFKQGYTVSSTDAAFAASEYRLYQNSVTTISIASGNIVKITITGSDTSKPISKLTLGDGEPGTWNGSTGIWTGSASSVSFVATAQARADSIVIEKASTAPDVVLSEESIDLKTNDEVGKQITATVLNVASPTYSWTPNNANVTLINADTATVTIKPNTLVDASATVTLTVGGVTPNITKTVSVSISIPEPGETAGTAFTVSEAIEHIDDVIDGGQSTGNDGNYYYATGIVSEIVTPLDKGVITYNISADGSTSGTQLQAYKGKGLNNTSFTSEDDLCVGDQVIIYGLLKFYSTASTYEFDSNNYLVSRVVPPQVLSINLNPSLVTVDTNETGDIVDLFADIIINQESGSTKTVNDIVWSSDDDNVFCVVGDEFIAGSTHKSSTILHASIGGKEYGHATIKVLDPNIPVIPYVTSGWLKLTSLNIGDTIAFVHEGSTNELTSVTTSGTTIGAVTAYDDDPSGSFLLTVEAGNGGVGYAFKTINDTYLSWASGNSLTTSAEKTDAASWTIDENHDGSDGNWKFANVGTPARILQYNSGSPRFACYGNDGQAVFQIYSYSNNISGDIELTSVVPTATLHATETNPGVVSNVYIEFGAKISIEQWNAIEDVANVTDYGVMLFRTRKALSSNKPVQDALDKGKTPTVISKGSGDVPSDPEGGYYSFTARVNVSSASNYDIMFCAAPFIEVNGTRYILSEVQYSVNTLADYYVTNSIPTDLSEDALLALMA